jgi:hypothetical protein
LVAAFQRIDDNLSEALTSTGEDSDQARQLQGLMDRVEHLLTAPALD